MIHPAKRILIFTLLTAMFYLNADAQTENTIFTHDDSLRGSMNAERRYNVIRYDLTFTPDYANRSLRGVSMITYQDSEMVDAKVTVKIIQIDLQSPMEIDSIIQEGRPLVFQREGNVFHVRTQVQAKANRNCQACVRVLRIYYHGSPHVAVRPPWDGGGFIFSKDSLGRPWMSVACEGAGASTWYPCKDYLGDKPDSGASLTMIIPDSLSGIGNGKLIRKMPAGKGVTAWTWAVVNPISNYNLVPYIGKYVNWRKTFYGQKGNLDCSYWVLDYDLKKARKHFTVVDSMLSCFEYWFGPYPFYEDGYKLVQAPFLGMEHQSNIAYGNNFMEGYLGNDLSETGWGLKWDYIIVHESGHEWFGNNITSRDLADEWIHEAFAAYSEVLYTGNYFGKNAGDDYCIGTRKIIENKIPVIQTYGVNKEPEDRDQYFKASNMIHMIRQILRDETIFRKMLHGLNQNFYHQTVDSREIISYINKFTGIDFTPVFNQYLRSTSIPKLEYRFREKYLEYRWTNCNADFNMQVKVDVNGEHWLKPTTEWKSEKITRTDHSTLILDKNFYVLIRKTE